MSSYEIDAICELLLKRYKEYGFLHPEWALEGNIRDLTGKGRTRDEAIRELHSSDEPWIYSPSTPASNSQQQKVRQEDIAVVQQIAYLREKIASLTTLFSKGEITKETYVRGVKQIEDDISRLQREHHVHVVERVKYSPTSTSGSVRHETTEENNYPYYSPSRAWYLVPFLFGIFGGIVAYVGVKDDDAEMADDLLIFGILWTLGLGFLGWFLLLR